MKDFSGWSIYPHSLVETGGFTCFLARSQSLGEKRLGVQGDFSGLQGEYKAMRDIRLYPMAAENAAWLRGRLPWLRPAPLGLLTSAGFGDRLGLATPGHVQSVRGTAIAPVFTQQSVRENERTHRSPQQVMDDATWGVFQEGWREPWGADADHLKNLDELDAFIAAGYTLFTVDPGMHVDHGAHHDSVSVLREKIARLPWEGLQSTPETLRREYLGHSFSMQGLELVFDEVTLGRAVAKYGRALAHTAQMYFRLAERMDPKPFDFEVSIDETETPTTVLEHFYIASELLRLGVRWTGLAPRFLGRFEKGVDYIGDLAAFEAELARHAAVMRSFGNYKLSLHSGSDKFSLYSLFAGHTKGRAHVKTAGTSYLEGLRVLAQAEPALFREALDYARECYPADRATYHVSGQIENVPPSASLADSDLPGLLDQFDARQVLHVTYGSVLDRYGDGLKAALTARENVYALKLKQHFERHLSPYLPFLT